MDTGPEPIADQGELGAVRAQARRVLAKGLALTALVMAVVMLLP